MTFAEKLRELRERAGLSQPQLAKASRVPLWTLRKFEQGRREPLWLVLFQLADALDVPVDAFRDCLAANHRVVRRKAKSSEESALGGDPDRTRKEQMPIHPDALTPTYKASPLTRSKMGTFTSRCRLLCERCGVVLGHVDSTFRHTGMSADQAIARWPEMREAVQQHEGECRSEKDAGPTL